MQRVPGVGASAKKQLSEKWGYTLSFFGKGSREGGLFRQREQCVQRKSPSVTKDKMFQKQKENS